MGWLREGAGFNRTDRYRFWIRRILANVRSQRKDIIRLLLLEKRSSSQSHLGCDLVRCGTIRGLYSLRVRHAQEHQSREEAGYAPPRNGRRRHDYRVIIERRGKTTKESKQLGYLGRVALSYPDDGGRGESQMEDREYVD